MAYGAAIGHNNIAGIVLFDPQPKQPNRIEYPQKVYGGTGLSFVRGFPTISLLWTNTLTRDTVSAINAVVGLSDIYDTGFITSNDVTLRIRESDDTWVDVNATISIPQKMSRRFIGWDDYTLTAIIHGKAT